MANEPTVKLAANAMTTLEDTMERLGIPPEAAEDVYKRQPYDRFIKSAGMARVPAFDQCSLFG